MERREIACVELCLLNRLMVGLWGDSSNSNTLPSDVTGHVTTNPTLSSLGVNKPNLDLFMMTSYDNKPKLSLPFYDVICTQT
jgi:hypothetical protein